MTRLTPDESPRCSTAPGGESTASRLAEPTPARRNRPVGWFVILLMFTVFLGRWVYTGLPDEIARWHLAAAAEQRLDGDLDGAIDSLSRTIEQFPDQTELYLTRGRWHRENSQFEAALKDCRQAAELAPDHPQVYLERSNVYWHLGRFDEAVEDMKKVLELSESGWSVSQAAALNGLAYARALAGKDLDQALQEVEAALASSSSNAAMLDTRGFILYLKGDYSAAREDLEEAVRLIEAEHTGRLEQLKGEQPGVLDLRESRLELEQVKKSVAVIRSHRALVYEALGMESQAQADFERIDALGYEPGDHLF